MIERADWGFCRPCKAQAQQQTAVDDSRDLWGRDKIPAEGPCVLLVCVYEFVHLCPPQSAVWSSRGGISATLRPKSSTTQPYPHTLPAAAHPPLKIRVTVSTCSTTYSSLCVDPIHVLLHLRARSLLFHSLYCIQLRVDSTAGPDFVRVPRREKKRD